MDDITAKRTVSVPGALREPFREFLDAAPGSPEGDAVIGAWDALQWRGRGGARGSSSADLTVSPEQARYLVVRLREFLQTDGTMLVRPQARKLRDRLEAPQHSWVEAAWPVRGVRAGVGAAGG
jgi:hypothetical protein